MTDVFNRKIAPSENDRRRFNSAIAAILIGFLLEVDRLLIGDPSTLFMVLFSTFGVSQSLFHFAGYKEFFLRRIFLKLIGSQTVVPEPAQEPEPEPQVEEPAPVAPEEPQEPAPLG
jgi:hypothetical protein